MWEPGVVIALVGVTMAFVGNAVAVTIFVVTMRGQIEKNNVAVLGKIEVLDERMKTMEAILADLKTTDRRLSLVEDRQAAMATRQGNMEADNLLIRADLTTLHQGIDRHRQSLDRFNETQLK